MWPALAADLQRLDPQFASLHVRVLNLSYNSLGDRGLAKLAEGLRVHLHNTRVMAREQQQQRGDG